MLITRNTLMAVYRGLRASFGIGLEDETLPMRWPDLATKVNSTTSEEEYSWFEGFPMMRRWVGDKELANLKERGYRIPNQDYEATVRVPRNKIRDNQLSGFAEIMRQAGVSARQHPDELLIDLINDGFTGAVMKAYTGKPYFATNHRIAGKAFSNKGTKALSSATLAAARDSIGAGRTAMQKACAESGRKLNVDPNMIWVPPALRDHAETLYKSDRLEDGKNNPYKGQMKPVVDARLDSDTAWHLFDTRFPVKPAIFQEREAPHVVTQDFDETESAFMRKEYLISAEARCGVGWSFPQLGYGSDGTT